MYTRSHKKILLIDDDIMAQFAARELLDHAGFNVDAACDGTDGVNLYRYYHYDMVLLDIHLPDISGFEVARLIRQFEQARKKSPVPIIAVSAMPDEYPSQRYQQAGIDQVFAKPIEPDRLDPIFMNLDIL